VQDLNIVDVHTVALEGYLPLKRQLSNLGKDERSMVKVSGVNRKETCEKGRT